MLLMPRSQSVVRWLASLRPLKARFAFGGGRSGLDRWMVRDSTQTTSNYPTTQLPNYLPGQVLVLSLLFFAVILILSASLFGRVTSFIRNGSNSIQKEQANSLAESGVERALYKLNTTAGAFYGDTTEETVGETGTSFVSVVDKSPTVKTITSTGYVGTSTNPKAARTIKVEVYLNGEAVEFNFATQVGNGGLTMANSSTIKGNVYTNGNITGSGSTTIEGDAYAVGTISYPDPLVTGTKNPGSSPQNLPSFNYDYWKKGACLDDPNYPTSCQTEVICSPTCTISSDTSIGNKKYNGNLNLTNNAVVTLNGPIWVTGNFSMSQGGTTLKLNDSFGSNGTVVIVDGTADLTQGGSLVPTNATPKGYIFLVTTSTADPAMSISQSGATALFFALEGTAELTQSAHVVSLTANKLSLKNSVVLEYDNGLASTLFTKGPGASWQLQKGTYKFVANP